MREIITLQCPECKKPQLLDDQEQEDHDGRLQFAKFCNTCRKHTPHKETK